MNQASYSKVNEVVNPALNSDKLTNVLNYCRANNVLFRDKEFPPDMSSLVGPSPPRSYRGQFNNIRWKRASEIFGENNFDVFVNRIDPGDVKQGSLGDCYFLCALASMAENPAMIKRLFEVDTTSPYGVYAVWVNVNGLWTRVVLDEYFPVVGDGPNAQLAFSKGDQNEIWVMLLEKAYAKVYGSYWNIVGGDPVHALRDLTGAPYERIEDLKDINETWQKLVAFHAQNFILTCFTKTTSVPEEKLQEGLVAGHAYSILNVVQTVDANGNLARLVQIRNPWGKFEWTGDFSDNSPLWTNEDRQRFNVVNKNDGIFWMRIEDFVRYFNGVGIVKTIPGFTSNGMMLDQTSSNLSVVRLIVRTPTKGYFSVDQYDSRFPGNNQKSYSYFRITLCRLVGREGVEYVSSIMSPERNIFVEGMLQPGEYLALIEGYWNDPNNPGKVNFGVYSNNDIEMQQIKVSQNFFHRMEYLVWKDFAKKNTSKFTVNERRNASNGYANAELISSKFQSTNLGVCLYNYQNLSQNLSIHDQVRFKQLQGFVPLSGNISPSGANLVINPQDNDVLIYKMDPRQNTFRLAHQVQDEELIPFKFTPDFQTIEAMRELGGFQTTPENPTPVMRSRQEMQQLYDQNQRERADVQRQMQENYQRNLEIQQRRKQDLIDQQRRTAEAQQRYTQQMGVPGWDLGSILGGVGDFLGLGNMGGMGGLGGNMMGKGGFFDGPGQPGMGAPNCPVV